MADNFLSLPERPGRLIFATDGFMTAHLLKTDDFVRYCKDRELNVTAERLNRFEELGVFRPLVRFIFCDSRVGKLCIPNGPSSEWFDRGYILDTYHPATQYEVPAHDSETSEAYFSIFQIDHLSHVLTEFNLTLHLESFAGKGAVSKDWNDWKTHLIKMAECSIEDWQTHELRRAIPLLCQYVANRYYPLTQTNQRVITYSSGGFSEDASMFINRRDWDWHEFSHEFDPKEVEEQFALTKPILKHAYETLGASACFCDPLDKWANLVEFASLHQKKNLKGKALRALAFRDAANMLRLLHKDLYGEDLKPTHQIFGQVITHYPELEVRNDVRRHLEFVVNQYDLNPQPKLVLFVEGESEIVLINTIFNDYFGEDPGVRGIELVNLQGVNNATGNKKTDRFRAIFRLIDYLHHHQTLTYLILDRENQSEKLKAEAKNTKSTHGQSRHAIPSDHIYLWKTSLEFDNFSDTEIATGMTTLSEGHAEFKSIDVKNARHSHPDGKALSKLYQNRTGYGLNKPKLASHLAAILVDPKSRRDPENRPLVKILNRACHLAVRNPFPERHETWLTNQESHFLGGSKKTLKPKKKAKGK